MRLIISLLLLGLLVGCGTTITPLQMQSLEEKKINDCELTDVFRGTRTVLQNFGYIVDDCNMADGFMLCSLEVPEKSVSKAFAYGFLPGGGRFYVRSYFGGVFDILTYPISILWDGPLAATKAAQMKKTIKVSITFVQRGPDVEMRLGFRNVEHEAQNYGPFIKQLYAEIERKSLLERSNREFLTTTEEPAPLNDNK